MSFEEQDAPAADAAPQGGATPKAEPVIKTIHEWAKAKGHIPPKGPFKHRHDPHRGKPHVRVIETYVSFQRFGKLVSGITLTEAEYDAAARAAYQVAIGETAPKGD